MKIAKWLTLITAVVLNVLMMTAGCFCTGANHMMGGRMVPALMYSCIVIYYVLCLVGGLRNRENGRWLAWFLKFHLIRVPLFVVGWIVFNIILFLVAEHFEYDYELAGHSKEDPVFERCRDVLDYGLPPNATDIYIRQRGWFAEGGRSCFIRCHIGREEALRFMSKRKIDMQFDSQRQRAMCWPSPDGKSFMRYHGDEKIDWSSLKGSFSDVGEFGSYCDFDRRRWFYDVGRQLLYHN